MPRQVIQNVDRPVELERLVEEIVGPERHAALAKSRRGEIGEDDLHELGRQRGRALQAVQQVEARAGAQVEIDDDGVRRLVLDRPPGIIRGFGEADDLYQSRGLQRVRQSLPDRGRILDQEDPVRGRRLRVRRA
jgi:hypothetical protein